MLLITFVQTQSMSYSKTNEPQMWAWLAQIELSISWIQLCEKCCGLVSMN